MTANNFFRYLAFEGLGWKDIHASNVDNPNPKLLISMRPYIKRALDVVRFVGFHRVDLWTDARAIVSIRRRPQG